MVRRFDGASLDDFDPIPQVEAFLRRLERVEIVESEKREYIAGSGYGAGVRVVSECDSLAGVDGLVIVGEVGRGKTYLAYAIAKAVPAHVPCRFVSALEIVDEAKQAIRGGTEPERYGTLNAVLILDDLSAIRPTDFALDTLTTIIRQRYDGMLPTVVTTHAGYDTLAEMYGAAIASRLLELGPIVKLNGPDRRRIKVAG